MAESVSPMTGKTCLVTGATSGIGRATALKLARAGARVVIVGRSAERCGAVVESIRRETGGAEVEYIAADLGSQAEVRRLAAEFVGRHSRLDVLINNAGALFALRRESKDGIELTLALNHLAPFLLTNLLLETLQKSAPSRIVNVSSDAHQDVKAFDFDDPLARHRRPQYGQSELMSLGMCLTMPWAHPAVVQYAQTKLANLLFTYELARRLDGTGVTANAVHPGFVSSNFGAGNGSLGFFMRLWSRVFGISAAAGAKSVLELACSPGVRANGQYYSHGKVVSSSPASNDQAAAERLWTLSEELTSIRGELRPE